MNKSPSDVVIVMSTYNGESYIDEQMGSLFRQSYSDWTLLVRDDGSSDKTRLLLERYAAESPRVILLPPDGARLGPWASFGTLLEAAFRSGARYVFMCDQDDVWEPNKVEMSLSRMKMEESASPGAPLLLHSDLSVVSERLEPIHSSFRKFQGVSYDHRHPLRTLLLHNAVLGCTAVANRALLALALPLPQGCDHDWWLAQCAAVAGRIIDVPQPTVRYRQHDSNATGRAGRRSALKQMLRNPKKRLPPFLSRFEIGVAQARQLERRLSAHGELPAREQVSAYVAAFDPERRMLARFSSFWRSGVRPRRIGSYLFLPVILGIFPHWRKLLGTSQRD